MFSVYLIKKSLKTVLLSITHALLSVRVDSTINMCVNSFSLVSTKILPKESLSQVGSTCLQTGPAVRHPTTQSLKKKNMTKLFQPNRVKATKTSKRKAIHVGLKKLRWWMNGRKWKVTWMRRIVLFYTVWEWKEWSKNEQSWYVMCLSNFLSANFISFCPLRRVAWMQWNTWWKPSRGHWKPTQKHTILQLILLEFGFSLPTIEPLTHIRKLKYFFLEHNE